MSNHDQHDHGTHSILTYGTAIKTFIALIILTVITVVVAQINLGPLNTPVALFVAAIKASLVILFFMNMKSEKRENQVYFSMSFLFLAIFLIETSMDIFTRGHGTVVAKVKEPFKISASAGGGGGKIDFQRFWEPRAELVAKGKEIYATMCVGCHGNAGAGDGPAAAAMNPKPRNFTTDANWKHGRKLADIYLTLTKAEGLQGMPAFVTIQPDHRFALAHFIRSLAPNAPQDSADDFARAGVDTSKPDGGLGGGGAKTIPIEAAMELMTR